MAATSNVLFNIMALETIQILSIDLKVFFDRLEIERHFRFGGILKKNETLHFSNIMQVRSFKLNGVSENGIKVILKNGKSYHFVHGDKAGCDQIIEILAKRVGRLYQP